MKRVDESIMKVYRWTSYPWYLFMLAFAFTPLPFISLILFRNGNVSLILLDILSGILMIAFLLFFYSIILVTKQFWFMERGWWHSRVDLLHYQAWIAIPIFTFIIGIISLTIVFSFSLPDSMMDIISFNLAVPVLGFVYIYLFNKHSPAKSTINHRTEVNDDTVRAVIEQSLEKLGYDYRKSQKESKWSGRQDRYQFSNDLEIEFNGYRISIGPYNHRSKSRIDKLAHCIDDVLAPYRKPPSRFTFYRYWDKRA